MHKPKSIIYHSVNDQCFCVLSTWSHKLRHFTFWRLSTRNLQISRSHLFKKIAIFQFCTRHDSTRQKKIAFPLTQPVYGYQRGASIWVYLWLQGICKWASRSWVHSRFARNFYCGLKRKFSVISHFSVPTVCVYLRENSFPTAVNSGRGKSRNISPDTDNDRQVIKVALYLTTEKAFSFTNLDPFLLRCVPISKVH